jgi:hypothetical protein
VALAVESTLRVMSPAGRGDRANTWASSCPFDVPKVQPGVV